MSSLSVKTDKLGAIASFLCMIHCCATPFLFVAQACSHTCCSSAPGWWRGIDFAFLIISFMAVARSVQSSSSQIVRIGLCISWLVLGGSILSEWFMPSLFSEWAKYSGALSLIGLHLYNMKFCQCTDDGCCAPLS